MTISVCPVATVEAPAEHVWAVLTDPDGYSAWWDARTERIAAPGPAAPGQVITARPHGAGGLLRVTITVVARDDARHALGLHSTFPLGISLDNHLRVQPLDALTCRLSFG
ncbi:MAG: SRPBCC family protein [Ktedonobacterales bacterium]